MAPKNGFIPASHGESTRGVHAGLRATNTATKHRSCLSLQSAPQEQDMANASCKCARNIKDKKGSSAVLWFDVRLLFAAVNPTGIPNVIYILCWSMLPLMLHVLALKCYKKENMEETWKQNKLLDAKKPTSNKRKVTVQL